MRRLAFASFIGALCMFTASCGGTAPEGHSESDIEVTVGVLPIANAAPIYVGKEQGSFSDEGIDLKLVEESGGAAAIPGVVSGNFDFSFGNLVSVITARAEGLPLKAVAGAISSTGEQGDDVSALMVPEKSPIKTPADLEGKTVAVNNLKNVGDMTISAIVRDDEGDPAKVNYVEMIFPDMLAALDSGRVDAVWEVEPFVTIGMNNGARAVSWNYAEAAPDMLIGAYFTSEELIASDPDLVQRFTRAFEKSKDFSRENPDAVREALLTYTEIDEAVAKEMSMPVWPEDLTQKDLDVVADLMLREGLLEKSFDTTELIQ